MYFHIDEAGNTGKNLFDASQPCLSYGVLSCLTNVDVLGEPLMRQIRNQIGRDRLHASQLNNKGLTQIAPLLAAMQQKMQFDFDYCFIEKRDYAVVRFFDAVFDQGLNPAVRWETYWTLLRFLIIVRLARILPDEVLKRSWEFSCMPMAQLKAQAISDLLAEVRAIVDASSLDQHYKEQIGDALDWGIAHPLELDYGTDNSQLISPNAVGFQFVSASIARRLRKKNRRQPASILIDRQTQFNAAQQRMHELMGDVTKGLASMTAAEKGLYIKHPAHAALSTETLMFRGVPDSWPQISGSENSIGLQIVDIYLWLTNRVLAHAELSPELHALWRMFSPRTTKDGISIAAMMERLARIDALLPISEGLTDAQKALFEQRAELHREKVRRMKAEGAL